MRSIKKNSAARQIFKINRRRVLLIILVLAAVLLRLGATNFGHNYDYESYKIVVEIVASGGNFYSETSRYNYGPVWAILLGIFHFISGLFANQDAIFRLLIVLLLSAADVSIFLILYKKFGLKAGLLFILNPLSVLITGYHNQFDNLALFTGLVSVILLDTQKQLTRKNIIASSLLLGLSLSIKHILFLLPVWLAIKQKNQKAGLALLTIPYFIFIISLAPFLIADYEAVMQNVFYYASAKNSPLITFFFTEMSRQFNFGFILLIFVLVLAGFFLKKKSNLKSFAYYTIVLVCFSPSILLNYLAISLIGVAVLPNPFFIIFSLISAFMVGLDSLGFYNPFLISIAPKSLLFEYSGKNIYQIPILFLTAGLVYPALKTKSISLIRSLLKNS